MKKFLSLLLVLAMIFSLAACGKKVEVDSQEIEEIEEEIEEDIEEFEEEIEEAIEDEEPEDEPGDPEAGRGPDYWAEYYGQNRCPFYITHGDDELKYYMKNGGKLPYWVYTSDNTDGWYIHNGYIISSDNKYAISLEEAEDQSFSSFCTYETKPYDGETLTKEQQAQQLNGVFYVLNPYTPVSTNWGLRFFTDDNRENADELPEPAVSGLTDTLNEVEEFDMYVMWNPDWYPDFDGDTIDLWAYKHRDMSEYPEVVPDELEDEAANIGCFEPHDPDDPDWAHIRTAIPDKEGNGMEPGLVDIVMTYAGDVVVGLVTVEIVA